jgi:hypothetical protein
MNDDGGQRLADGRYPANFAGVPAREDLSAGLPDNDSGIAGTLSGIIPSEPKTVDADRREGPAWHASRRQGS